ncbi:MAG: Ribosomal RNA large subunit methyltransferase I [Planctomycetes bacterium]|nr:Ribosomal RNA large subunit methyltransferase I [Planctomycetota bacterium]
MDVVLKRGRERSLLLRHPWVFAGSIAAVTGEPSPGEAVELVSFRGDWLARGAWSPHSQIRVRAWTFDPDEAIDEAFFERRLHAALELRRRLGLLKPDTAFRLCNAENDGLPGLVIDHYAGWHVGQFLGAGAEHWKEAIVNAAMKLLPAQGFHERSDVEVRRKEGLELTTGTLRGEAPHELVEFDDSGLRLLADLHGGHKTGAYLDQAVNRRLVRETVRPGDSVLNVFCYTGGFGLHAARAGAGSVTQLDQSADALALALRNAELNGLSGIEYIQGNAFEELRKLRDAGRQFDCVILDPPKFAPSAASVDKALGAYKDVNLLGFQLLRPGGMLFTFSCSGHVTRESFTQVVAAAAADAGRDARILRQLSQSPDHTIGLQYPEGEYLKGLQLFAV